MTITGSTAKLNAQQLAVLGALAVLLEEATRSGVLDVLQPNLASPDSINDVCDTVTDLWRTEYRPNV